MSVVLLVISLFLGLYLSRHLWLPPIGAFLIVADPLAPADAILPLAGELERVSYAATLYGEYAPRLLLTNMALPPNQATNYALQAKEEVMQFPIPEEAVMVVPGSATTTYEEAVNILSLMQQEGWTSLIVVTAPWHTRRSRIIFRDVFHGMGIGVSVQPVRGTWYHPNFWWKTSHARQVTWSEYLKLAAHFVGIR
jgi:uncharacterized SAM-binding protein YcdF (DUF218 family)